jgi:Uma2 family endonuclease
LYPYISAERLRQSPRAFGQLIPDMVVEIKSKTDRVKKLEEKIEMYLALAARVGIIIDPDKQTVTIYRLNSEPTVLNNEDIFTIPELFPGWELPVAELWPPVFE